jgi:hypothetical protein
MKRILALLVILFALCSVSRASTNSFGAWWETTHSPDGARGAGALFVLFEGDVTSHSGTGGVVTVTMVYNILGESYEISGHYNRRDENIVTFEATPAILTYFSPPAWKGQLNLASGQCNGTWLNPPFHNGSVRHPAIRGKFQSHVRPPRPN